MKSPSWKISRRHALRGLGAALLLPRLEVMGEESVPPRRLVCLFQPNGVLPSSWDPDPVTGLPGAILEPLAGLRDSFSILRGIDNSGLTPGHVGLTSAFLTGVGLRGGRNAVSLDQAVARHLAGRTRFDSLELGTEPPRQGSDGGQPISSANSVSWSSETIRLNPEIHPRVAFDRLFAIQVSPEARRRAEMRSSVLDLIREDAADLKRRVSHADLGKIDEYFESVREVEKRMARTLTPPAREWSPPREPELVAPPADLPADPGEHLRLMMDVLVLALQTDSTRVATLMTAHGFSRRSFAFLEGVSGDHHGMSHHRNKLELTTQYERVSTWFIAQFRYLLERMAAVNEGPGTLLDHSLVLYGSGMKDGNGHTREDLPLLLAGGGSGLHRPGGTIACAPGTPIANLHLALGRSMGLEWESFNGVSTGTVSF